MLSVRVRWQLVLVGFVGAAAQAGPLTPGNAGGHFVVEDALSQFNALKHHGEALGWRNPEGAGAPDPSIFDHYQGLARYPGTGTPVFYVTQKDNDDGGIIGGYLSIVRFATRPTTGERLRSNLQEIGNDTEEMVPVITDTWVRSIRFDGSLVVDGRPLAAYVHPGSMAIVDDILFVPLDTPDLSGACCIGGELCVELGLLPCLLFGGTFHGPGSSCKDISCGGSPQAVSSTPPSAVSTSPPPAPGVIVLFDLAVNRETPPAIQVLELDHNVDNLAVTQSDEGKYLVWTNGDGGSIRKFYETTHTDLRNDALGLTFVDDVAEPADWPTGSGAHQSSTFLREPDGSLFLIGMRHPGGLPGAGDDKADLYEVQTVGNDFSLVRLAEREMHCVYDGGGGAADMRICNFGAASNAYVTPTGEMILYSIPHDDEDSFTDDFARMGEFRHQDVNRGSSPLRLPGADAGGPYVVDEGAMVTLSGSGSPPADRPWAELYDDDNFNDRSIVVDYDDQTLLELDDFDDLDNFGDKTSSVRWRAPVGVDFVLYEHHDFGGRTVVLSGSGSTETIADLDAYGFGDDTSSAGFLGSPPAAGDAMLAWDLDGDGMFGETGQPATFGNEIGTAPIFDALDLDGPTNVPVMLHVTFSGLPGTGTVSAVVEVLNVAPIARVDSIDGGLEGIALIALPVTLGGSYDDVPVDTHTAVVDWDDGQISAAVVDNASDELTASHTYSTAGERTVELVVTDDDSGVGTAQAPLTVHDPVSAAGTVLGWIDAWIAMASDPQAADALQQARDWLDGNNQGQASNGALDKLESGDLVAALVKIAKVIVELEEAEAADGSDLSVGKILLTLVAQSVAQVAFEDAIGAVGPNPTPDEQAALAQIEALIADGIALSSIPDYVAAVHSFRFATAKALDLVAQAAQEAYGKAEDD